MRERVRTWFSAPLVVITAGCSSAKAPPVTPPTPVPDAHGSGAAPVADRGKVGFAYVDPVDTACVYGIDFSCGQMPPGSSCNPPMPRLIECPAGLDGKSGRYARGPSGQADDCLLVVAPCADVSCGIESPCPDTLPQPRSLQWTIGALADSKRCLATPSERTKTWGTGMLPIQIDCPAHLPDRKGFVERPAVDAECFACATSPCTATTTGAKPVACPDAKL